MPFLDLKNVKTLRACMREVVPLLGKTTAKQKRNLGIINILQASLQRHCYLPTKMLSLVTCCSRKNEISLVVVFSSKSLVRSSEPSNKMNRKDDKIWGKTLESVSFYYRYVCVQWSHVFSLRGELSQLNRRSGKLKSFISFLFFFK